MLISWEFLLNYIIENPLPKITRLDEIHAKYKQHKKYLKDNNINVKNYIIEKYIHNNPYCLRPKTFPYNIESKI